MSDNASATATVETKTVTEAEIRDWCVSYIARALDYPTSEVDPNAEFDRFGLDSAITTAMIIDLEEWLNIDIPPSVIFEQTTISSIASELSKRIA